VGSLAWKMLGTGATVGAGTLARRVATTGWKLTTGSEPPANPEDPDVSWKEALAWAVASGAAVGVARLLAARMAAAYFTKSAGHPPADLNKVS